MKKNNKALVALGVVTLAMSIVGSTMAQSATVTLTVSSDLPLQGGSADQSE